MPISTSAAGRSSRSLGWVKQTLKLTRFPGTSENAVRIQIAAALIAFLLLRLAQTTRHSIASPLASARLVRVDPMHRRRLDRLREPDPPSAANPRQWLLQWTEI